MAFRNQQLPYDPINQEGKKHSYSGLHINVSFFLHKLIKY